MRILPLFCTLVSLSSTCATVPAAENEFSASLAWKQVIEKGDIAGIQESYLLAQKLEGETGNFDPELCRSEALRLEKALEVNPASLAVQAAASGCAAALQNHSLAERHAQNFAALAREAIGDHIENFGEIPVRVMAEPDIVAFIKASGEEAAYLYYAPNRSGASIKMHVALTDTEHARERWLSFDFLDAQVAVQRKAAYAEFPIFRFQLVKYLLRSVSAAEGTVAGESKELYAALANLKGDELEASLIALARQGNYAAMNHYVYACLQRRAAECESTSMDLLLPWAEAHGAMAMTLLAVLQADPMLGKADEKSARTLLDAADRRLGGCQCERPIRSHRHITTSGPQARVICAQTLAGGCGRRQSECGMATGVARNPDREALWEASGEDHGRSVPCREGRFAGRTKHAGCAPVGSRKEGRGTQMVRLGRGPGRCRFTTLAGQRFRIGSRHASRFREGAPLAHQGCQQRQCRFNALACRLLRTSATGD